MAVDEEGEMVVVEVGVMEAFVSFTYLLRFNCQWKAGPLEREVGNRKEHRALMLCVPRA